MEKGPPLRMHRYGALQRIRIALDRPRFWRVTTALAALLFCLLLAGVGQGSVDVIARQPTAAPMRAPWERWCTRGAVRVDRVRIAFCARVEGIIVYSNRGPGPGEAHIAVVGGFHLTVVKLPARAAIPAVGSRVVAIGPLFRARNGQREVQAFRLVRS
jgi:hypothetical protein